MNCISIKQLCVTGKFGPVTLGMNKAEVIKALGDPDGTIDVSRPNSGIHYSMYEFFFDGEDRLFGFQNDHCDPEYPEGVEYKGLGFEVDPWIFRQPSVLNQQSLKTKLNLPRKVWILM